jgi:hypothetical protein
VSEKIRIFFIFLSSFVLAVTALLQEILWRIGHLKPAPIGIGLMAGIAGKLDF